MGGLVGETVSPGVQKLPTSQCLPLISRSLLGTFLQSCEGQVMKFRSKNSIPRPAQPSEEDLSGFWRGDWPVDKQVFCDDWMQKRSLTAARIFFGFNIIYHLTVSALVELWLEKGDVMIAKAQMHHAVGLIYSAVLILVFDRSFRKIGILYGATQIFVNAGSVIIIAYEVIVGRPEMHVLQAYMVSTAVSFVSIIASPYSKPWSTGVVFLQNSVMIVAMSFIDQSAGLSVALGSIFLSALGWILQTGIVKKSLKEAAQEYESRKILAKLARIPIDQELRFAQYIEESFLPPDRVEIGPHTIECLRQRNGQMGGYWFAIRPSGETGVFILLCETYEYGVHGALILHAVQSLWAEDLSGQTFDPEKWLQKANRALFVLGKSERHEVEITLVHLDEGILTYWGAGRNPIYLTQVVSESFSEIQSLSMEVLNIGRSEHVFPRAAKVSVRSGFRVYIGNKNVLSRQITTSTDLERIQEGMRPEKYPRFNQGNNGQSRCLIVISGGQIKQRANVLIPA